MSTHPVLIKIKLLLLGSTIGVLFCYFLLAHSNFAKDFQKKYFNEIYYKLNLKTTYKKHDDFHHNHIDSSDQHHDDIHDDHYADAEYIENENSFILPISDAIPLYEIDNINNDDTDSKSTLLEKDQKKFNLSNNNSLDILFPLIEEKINQRKKQINNFYKELKKLNVSINKDKYVRRKDYKKIEEKYTDIINSYPEYYNVLKEAEIVKLIYHDLPFVKPAKKYRITSTFGWRSDPFKRTKRFHHGLDFAAKRGTPLYSPANGTVIYAGWKGGYGKVVEIKHANNVITRYGHLSRIYVKKGQKIKKNKKFAAIGSTGRSTGPHLHYEINVKGRKINPYLFIRNKINKVYTNINK